MKIRTQFISPPLRFVNIVEQYVKIYFAQNDLSHKTKRNYDSQYNRISEYLDIIERPNISIKEIGNIFLDDFIVHLRKTHSLGNTGRIIELCKDSVEFARKRKIIKVNEISDVKIKRDKIRDVVYLDTNELQRLLYPQLEPRELEITMDLYIFQANTGMSFGDLWSYRIVKDQIGEWIYNKRNKNNNQYWVPLSPDAKRIHEKYNGQVPKIRLNNYNRKLKLVAEREKIPKILSSHTARKTFATHKYEGGWSIESIADMMGITVHVLLRHYIKKSRKRLENEVLAMQEKTYPVVEADFKLKIVQ